jgi:hypothetical protein
MLNGTSDTTKTIVKNLKLKKYPPPVNKNINL